MLRYNVNLPREGARITIGPALAGDLNDDGRVGMDDALLALRGALGLSTLTSPQQFAADIYPTVGVNGRAVGDGVIDLNDVLRILRRAIGLIPDSQWP